MRTNSANYGGEPRVQCVGILGSLAESHLAQFALGLGFRLGIALVIYLVIYLVQPHWQVSNQ